MNYNTPMLYTIEEQSWNNPKPYFTPKQWSKLQEWLKAL